VELLILRILRGGFAGTLVTGALSAAACESGADEPGARTRQDPSTVGATDGAVASSDGAVASSDGAVRIPDSAVASADAAVGVPVDGGSTPSDAGKPTPTPDASVPSVADAGATDAALPSDAGTAPSCTAETPNQLRAAGFTTTDKYDYIAVRQVSGNFGPPKDAGTPPAWTLDTFKVLSETGTSCATATDGACATQVAHHPSAFVQSYCVMACVEYSVVTTRGNEVKRWATDAELATLFGKVDSADEAILFAMRSGFSAPCVSQEASGLQVVATHYKDTCPIVYERVTMRVSDAGKLEVVGAVELPNQPGTGACVGRVPAGLCSVSEVHNESAVGDFLANAAHLEDASVYAFERLARELTAYGAPRDMIATALHAADDEVRHARVVGALARARGGQPIAAEVEELPLRTLEEIATENATEGCVRETYGALVGGYQARNAGDLGVRAAMREVAADEARHAALSHRVHMWAMSVLELDARERVLVAQRRAIAELTVACRDEVDEHLRTPLGLPSSAVAASLLRELSLSLWERQGVTVSVTRRLELSGSLPLSKSVAAGAPSATMVS
jgi:hypothetical protein